MAPANSTQPATQAANPTPEVEPHLLADAPVTEPPMKVAFDAETVDAGWGPSFEGLIAQAMQPFSTSALVSAECKTTICKIVAKKNFVVEQALLYFMEARREVPDEALIPARLVVDDADFDGIAKQLAAPPAPTPALRKLMRGDDD